MITNLTPTEELNIRLAAAWFDGPKRGSIVRKLNKIDKEAQLAKRKLLRKLRD